MARHLSFSKTSSHGICYSTLKVIKRQPQDGYLLPTQHERRLSMSERYQNLRFSIYSCFILLTISLFLMGWLILPNISCVKERLQLKERYSIFFGVSLAGLPLVLVMSFDYFKIKKEVEWRRLILFITVSLILACAILHPLFFAFAFGISGEKYNEKSETLVVIFSFLTSIAGLVVYLLGSNHTLDVEEKDAEKEKIRTFLIRLITLVSLISIAITFTLSPSTLWSSTHRRGVIASSYCLVPIAIYALGYLAKSFKAPLVKMMCSLLSSIFSFFLGVIALSVLAGNIFGYSANVILFLVIGFSLALSSEIQKFLNHLKDHLTLKESNTTLYRKLDSHT